jgi:tRNA-splicing ligase RtcB (3'-phosphate/5'-hydroxy nucleic acid ligase)
MIEKKIIDRSLIQKINAGTWRIAADAMPGMFVPATIIATEEMLDDITKDGACEQLINVAALPGIVKSAFGMPDMHEGYGFPIGGVAATKFPDGVISPGGIGYDINCGVRLLLSNLTYTEVRNKLPELAKKLYKWVPSGVGRGGKITLTPRMMEEVLGKGLQWAVDEGYATAHDQAHCESSGFLANADPSAVSDLAKKRGFDQLGTIGSGNHFVEVDVVENIFDAETAQKFGLFQDQLVVLIHTGSRGLGHQVATDYISQMLACMESKYGIQLPDPELACVPLSSPEGKNYFNAMAAAANFAWTNRQIITWEAQQAWTEVFGPSEKLTLLYDVAHNIAKIEDHMIDGRSEKLIVHRKGATRAFGPGSADLSPLFQSTGQPVLIPGSMGTSSYVLAGTTEGMELTFGSCCHGAGRRLSRSSALKTIDSKVLSQELYDKGIHVQAGSIKGLAEEAPQAYKDVDVVINSVVLAGIAKRVVRVRPCVVVKG